MTDVNKKMAWEEIVKSYPDKWVVMTNCVYDKLMVVSCTVVCVLDDTEIFDFEEANINKDYQYERTTDGGFNGVITLENANISII